MSRKPIICLVGVVLLCGSGCGTIASFLAETEDGHRSLIYGGVQLEAKVIGNMFSGDSLHGTNMFWWGLMYLIDLPLSFVADTLTLPITVAVELFRKPKKEPRRIIVP